MFLRLISLTCWKHSIYGFVYTCVYFARPTIAIAKIRDYSLSNHFTIMCNFDIVKPRFERKAISSRNLKLVAIDAFRDCIERSLLLTDSLEDISRSVALYHLELSRILDCCAPLSTRVVTIRPAAPWYSNETDQDRIKAKETAEKTIVR